ncbi:MAG: tetratricopeptide repeat protein [Proteobacteria bacterium]|nr:tetratricopeptide repeat protein [Pseudomonadota bacterium]
MTGELDYQGTEPSEPEERSDEPNVQFLYDDDEPLMSARRSYRAVWLAAAALALLIGGWSVARAMQPRETVAETDPPGEQTPIAADRPDEREVEPRPALSPVPAVVQDDVVDRSTAPMVSDSRKRRARKRSSRSRRRSRSRDTRPVQSSQSQVDKVRAAAAALLNGGESDVPASKLQPATSTPAKTAASAAESSPPARVARSAAVEQPLDPFAAGDQPVAGQRPSKEQPLDPFAAGSSSAGREKPSREQPLDPFATRALPVVKEPPAKEQPLDPFATGNSQSDKGGPVKESQSNPSSTSASERDNSPPRQNENLARAEFFVKLGKAHLAAGRHDAAATTFARALGLDPDNRAARDGLAAAKSAQSQAE